MVILPSPVLNWSLGSHRVKTHHVSLPKPALFEDINLYDLELEGTKLYDEKPLPGKQHLFSSTLLQLKDFVGDVCSKSATSLVIRAGIFKQSMGSRNRVGIGLSYQPARLHKLAELIPSNRFPAH